MDELQTFGGGIRGGIRGGRKHQIETISVSILFMKKVYNSKVVNSIICFFKGLYIVLVSLTGEEI